MPNKPESSAQKILRLTGLDITRCPPKRSADNFRRK
jgi:hypothetical protein